MADALHSLQVSSSRFLQPWALLAYCIRTLHSKHCVEVGKRKRASVLHVTCSIYYAKAALVVFVVVSRRVSSRVVGE
jgi:hypothetical protein